jgi:hypothetical protein
MTQHRFFQNEWKKENGIKTCEMHGRKVIKALGILINGNKAKATPIKVNSQHRVALV